MIAVAVITGPVGVGKTTVLQEADALLVSAGIPHATVELENLARFWGAKAWQGAPRRDVGFRNLASVWANYSAAGADRLLLSLLMERPSDLLPVHEAIPDARITVVRLHAPLAIIEERVRRREVTATEPELTAARWWVSRMEGSTFADHLVDNSDRSPRQTAADVLRRLGWFDEGTLRA